MSKFNIGDIVKLNFSDSIYSGKEFKITDCEDGFYMLESDGHNCYGVAEEYLKAVEDNNMNNRELTFREVITQIKEDEIWESEHQRIEIIDKYIKISSIDFDEYDLEETTFAKGYIAVKYDGVFRLKREEYTTDEAYRFYKDYKEIESVVTGRKYKIDYDILAMSIEEFEGKWYVNNK